MEKPTIKDIEIDGERFWALSNGTTVSFRAMQRYFNEDELTHFKFWLPIFECEGDLIERLSKHAPHATVADAHMAFDLFQRYQQMLKDELEQAEKLLECMEDLGCKSISEAVEVHGQEAVEEKLGFRLRA